MALDTPRVSKIVQECNREPFRSLKPLINGNIESVDALEPLIWEVGATDAKTDESAVQAIKELESRRAYHPALRYYTTRACIFKNIGEIKTAMQTKMRDTNGNTIDVQMAASYEHRCLLDPLPMSTDVPFLSIQKTGIHRLRQKLITLNRVARKEDHNLDMDEIIEVIMSQLKDICGSPATESVETNASDTADKAPSTKRRKTMRKFSFSKLKKSLEEMLRAGEFDKLNQTWQEIRW
jgi:hypothetical protein